MKLGVMAAMMDAAVANGASVKFGKVTLDPKLLTLNPQPSTLNPKP